MPVPMKMPQLGITMTEGKIVRWLKQEGDPVKADQTILEIETDKINAEVESPAEGTLARLQAQEGDTVPVIGLLAIIAAADDTDETIELAIQEAKAAAAAGTAASRATASPRPTRPRRPGRAAGPAAAGGRIAASPVARRLARELSVELSTVQGSGPGGRIVEGDVRAAAESAPGAAAGSPASGTAAAEVSGLTAAQTFPVAGIRQVIGERMATSLREMAQLTVVTEADATALRARRTDLVATAEQAGQRGPGYTDLLLWLLARTLPKHPLLNASLIGDEVRCWREVNIGVAVALESGLVVPVVRSAHAKSLADLTAEVASLVERARDNRLGLDELQGGTFTVTNLGMYDIDAFTPIINPPQSAILGLGRIVPRPTVVDDAVTIRHMMTLSLSFDHRVVDGAPAAQFLQALKQGIEQGEVGE